MKTDKIKISNDGDGMELALVQVGRFADYIFLDKKEALRLRLLVEETFGMLKTIAVDFRGDFWIEGGESKLCYIRIVVQTMIYLEKKRQFQKLSTERAKTGSKGFMKKLGHFIERGIYGSEDDDAKKQEDPSFMYSTMGMSNMQTALVDSYIYQWTLDRYKKNLEGSNVDNVYVADAWDELEKSIVANIADDVRVSIKGDRVDIAIKKQF